MAFYVIVFSAGQLSDQARGGGRPRALPLTRPLARPAVGAGVRRGGTGALPWSGASGVRWAAPKGIGAAPHSGRSATRWQGGSASLGLPWSRGSSERGRGLGRCWSETAPSTLPSCPWTGHPSNSCPMKKKTYSMLTPWIATRDSVVWTPLYYPGLGVWEPPCTTGGPGTRQPCIIRP